ncbi:hypothetical protein OIV83_002899 [Microbotryomycetes sp. JL201]|nr:hypothetical protein OIV83_002899 [Microbotryomycetes sp. JL201]
MDDIDPTLLLLGMPPVSERVLVRVYRPIRTVISLNNTELLQLVEAMSRPDGNGGGASGELEVVQNGNQTSHQLSGRQWVSDRVLLLLQVFQLEQELEQLKSQNQPLQQQILSPQVQQPAEYVMPDLAISEPSQQPQFPPNSAGGSSTDLQSSSASADGSSSPPTSTIETIDPSSRKRQRSSASSSQPESCARQPKSNRSLPLLSLGDKPESDSVKEAYNLIKKAPLNGPGLLLDKATARMKLNGLPRWDELKKECLRVGGTQLPALEQGELLTEALHKFSFVFYVVSEGVRVKNRQKLKGSADSVANVQKNEKGILRYPVWILQKWKWTGKNSNGSFDPFISLSVDRGMMYRPKKKTAPSSNTQDREALKLELWGSKPSEKLMLLSILCYEGKSLGPELDQLDPRIPNQSVFAHFLELPGKAASKGKRKVKGKRKSKSDDEDEDESEGESENGKEHEEEGQKGKEQKSVRGESQAQVIGGGKSSVGGDIVLDDISAERVSQDRDDQLRDSARRAQESTSDLKESPDNATSDCESHMSSVASQESLSDTGTDDAFVIVATSRDGNEVHDISDRAMGHTICRQTQLSRSSPQDADVESLRKKFDALGTDGDGYEQLSTMMAGSETVRALSNRTDEFRPALDAETCLTPAHHCPQLPVAAIGHTRDLSFNSFSIPSFDTPSDQSSDPGKCSFGPSLRNPIASHLTIHPASDSSELPASSELPDVTERKGNQGLSDLKRIKRYQQSVADIKEGLAPALPWTRSLWNGFAPLPTKLPAILLAAYEPLELIGRGGSGFVLRCVRRKDGLEYAIKLIDKQRVSREGLQRCMWEQDAVGLEQWPDGTSFVPYEAYFLRRSSHASVVQFADLFADSSYFYLVMEYHGSPWKKAEKTVAQCSNPQQTHSSSELLPIFQRMSSTDLFEFIEMHTCCSEETGRFIFNQVFRVVADLRQRGIIYRGITDQHITCDLNGIIKLIDFRSAFVFNPVCSPPWFPGEYARRFAWQSGWVPAEALLFQPFGLIEAEIWSLGVLLHKLLTGQKPFASDEDIIRDQRMPISGRVKLSNDAQNLIDGCLDVDPEDRFTLEQIARHPWMQTKAASSLEKTREIGSENICLVGR